jgi:hypothetical protein
LKYRCCALFGPQMDRNKRRRDIFECLLANDPLLDRLP